MATNAASRNSGAGQGSSRTQSGGVGSSAGISKATRRPPRPNTNQQQSLDCLKAIAKSVEASEDHNGTLTKMFTQDALPCMISMQQEISELKADSSMRWEAQREMYEEYKKEVEERHNAVMTKLDLGMELWTRGSGASNGSEGIRPTMQSKVEAAMDWLKYQVILEFIDYKRGADLYESLSGTLLKPSKMILNAAKWALGNDTTDGEAVAFLRKGLPDEGSRNNPPKVYSVLTVAHNRVLEPIRESFIRSFLFGLEETNPLHPRNESEKMRRRRNGNRSDDHENNGNRNLTEAQKEAIDLYQSGNFKTKDSYDNCWIRAWRTALREGFATAHILHTHLRSHRPEADIVDIPAIPQTQEENQNISIYALGFLRLKVSKFIQKLAEDDHRGMRLSHAPLWAKEVIRIHKVIRRSLEATEEGEAIDPCDARVNGLIIHKSLSDEERDNLEES